MIFFKVECAKRDRRCGMCKEKIERNSMLFKYFHYDKKTIEYPLQENICLQCADKLTNPIFVSYIGQLYHSLKIAQSKYQQIKRQGGYNGNNG